MRRIIVSSLFLSAALLTAQTSTKDQGVTLEARNEAPNALTASAASAQPVTDASSTPKQTRISSVTEPKLLKFHPVELAASDFHTLDVGSKQLILHFEVDEKGTPQNISVVKSVNQEVDERMMTAVRQYRYAPAVLDWQAVASDLNLVVRVPTP